MPAGNIITRVVCTVTSSAAALAGTAVEAYCEMLSAAVRQPQVRSAERHRLEFYYLGALRPPVYCASAANAMGLLHRAREALRQCLPNTLRDNSFMQCLKDDLTTKKWLTTLLHNIGKQPGRSADLLATAHALFCDLV